MRKGFIIFILACLAMFFALIFGYYGNIVFTVGMYTLVINGVIMLIFIFTYEKRIVKKDIKKFPLELLEINGENIYLIMTCDEKHSLFSYLDENGKNRLCDIEYAYVESLKTNEKPYVEIYENIYKPKGFVDFFYYDKKYEQLHKINMKCTLMEI